MLQISVTNRSGEVHLIDAEENQTLMEVIRDSNIDGLDAICGGCCSCATCHVYVDTRFIDQLPPVSEDEDILLDGSNHRKPAVSRLSCQIRLSSSLNGLALEIAPED